MGGWLVNISQEAWFSCVCADHRMEARLRGNFRNLSFLSFLATFYFKGIRVLPTSGGLERCAISPVVQAAVSLVSLDGGSPSVEHGSLAHPGPGGWKKVRIPCQQNWVWCLLSCWPGFPMTTSRDSASAWKSEETGLLNLRREKWLHAAVGLDLLNVTFRNGDAC